MKQRLSIRKCARVPGARITATVYDGEFATLYNVKVVGAAPAAPKN